MSGVIINGKQGEHCNGCGDWIEFDNLGYMKPSANHKHGLDLCVDCVDIMLRCRLVKFSTIKPAPMWKRAKVEIK